MTVRHSRRLLRLLALLLCLLLVPGAACGAKSAAPAEIRVCLRRLNLTDQVWMTLTGRYLADVRHITRGILAGELVGSEESYPVGNFEVHCRVVSHGLMPNGYSYNPENL